MKPTKSVGHKTTFVMVVDIGTIFIKYSLFANFNGMTNYLLRNEIKYMNEIYNDGTINYNLLKRDLRRKVEEFRQLGEIDTLIVIPQRNVNEGLCLPRFEYREESKVFKASVKASYRSIENVNNVFDWSRLNDQPDLDYHSIIIDSVPEDMVININEIIVDLNVRGFIVTSPLVGYLNIFEHDNKAHAIVDIGHSITRVAIVKNGIIYLYRDRSKAGHHITEAIASDHNSTYEAMEYKHNSQFGSLPNGVNSVIDEVKSVLKQCCEEYANNYNDIVKDYCIVGGTANLEIEEDINAQTVGINRVYPVIRLDNDKKLIMETRNYLYNSVSAFHFYMENRYNKDRVIDFSASKSGGIGIKVKTLVHNYKKFKAPLIAGLAGLYILGGSIALMSYKVEAYGQEITALKGSYDDRLSTVSSEQANAYKEFNDLNAESLAQKGSNTGRLLEKMKAIAPEKVSIKSLKLEGNGDTGILVLRSDSQVAISSFLTLMQDPIEGVYKKVTIANIELKEHLDTKYYETTLNLQGRNI